MRMFNMICKNMIIRLYSNIARNTSPLKTWTPYYGIRNAGTESSPNDASSPGSTPSRPPPFDTYAMVKSLQQAGFTEQQAEVIKTLLVQSLADVQDSTRFRYVTKHQKELSETQLMSQISGIRKDMIILEKSEFSQLKHEYEKQNIEIKQIRSSLSDELSKLEGGVKLSLNLEKARATEAHQQNKTDLAALNNHLAIELARLDGRISKVDSNSDRKVAQAQAEFEKYKNDLTKYTLGMVVSLLAVSAAIYRILKG